MKRDSNLSLSKGGVFLVHYVDKLIVHLPVASGIAGKPTKTRMIKDSNLTQSKGGVFLVHNVDKMIVHLPVASGIAGKTNKNTNEKRFKFILEQGWGIFGALH